MVSFKAGSHIETYLNLKNSRQVYCEFCGKHFTNRGNYAGHIRSNHTGEKPFECKECSKRFYNNGDLKKHLLHVHSNTPQTCETCFKIFRSIISLRRHKKIHVAIRERKFECNFENCDKKFLTNALLQQVCIVRFPAPFGIIGSLKFLLTSQNSENLTKKYKIFKISAPESSRRAERLPVYSVWNGIL